MKIMAEYLPLDEPGLAGWFENYALKMEEQGANHGFTPEEIKQAKSDAEMTGNIVAGGQAIEAYRSEYVGFKRIMLYGAKNAATPVYPAFAAPVIPPSLAFPMLAGIVRRTKSYVRRLRESANFNEAVEADFRIQIVKPAGISEADAKPSPKPQAMADSKVDMSFVKSGFDGIELEMQRGADANAWNSLGRFYNSPAEDETPPAVPNAPETRRYRARFLKGNKPVGVYSDIITVVTNP